MNINDLTELERQFEAYHRTGERVKVVLNEGWENYSCYSSRSKGLIQHFYVGRSTGVKPVYLMLARRDSIGGTPVPPEKAIKSITGTGKYRNGRG